MTPPVRRSGLLIPLFSAPSSDSWGIGDIGDIAALARWLSAAGQRVLQLLPLNEMAAGTQSPYSAMSAMAIDPIYIRVPEIEDFAALGPTALTEQDRAALDAARAASKIEYARIRPVKARALRAAFDRFIEHEWNRHTARAAALRDYIAGEAWWLHDYALFRAVHDREQGTCWTEWPEAIRRRDADALVSARASLAHQILFYEYVQWIAGLQWAAARAQARACGVALFGDLPFMVDLHSADVWMHQAQFHVDRSVGVPPDAFSATGQDWGMPAYDWDALEAQGYGWLKDRALRSAALFDGYRVDHLVGFYRTYSRPRSGDGEPSFSPDVEDAQVRLGEQVLSIFREPGAEIIAEDLGVVPAFVRASLARLEVPGFRVFRWERDWDEAGQPFKDPAAYPALSVATSGTHDTEPLITWWEQAPVDERAAMAAVPAVAAAAGAVDLLEAPFVPQVRDALVEALLASGSSLVLFPVQDVFGWRARINVPATVNDDNWSYRLPWPSDRLHSEPEAVERCAALKASTTRHGRS